MGDSHEKIADDCLVRSARLLRPDEFCTSACADRCADVAQTVLDAQAEKVACSTKRETLQTDDRPKKRLNTSVCAKRPPLLAAFHLLHQSCGFQRLVRTTLFHCLETASGDVDGDFLVELGDEESLFLQIHLAAACAGGIEFGRTRAVGVSASDAAFLSRYVAFPCHIVRVC